MVGFVHFSNFFIPSEKYYKLQSCWIALYYNYHHHITYYIIIISQPDKPLVEEVDCAIKD